MIYSKTLSKKKWELVRILVLGGWYHRCCSLRKYPSHVWTWNGMMVGIEEFLIRWIGISSSNSCKYYVYFTFAMTRFANLSLLNIILKKIHVFRTIAWGGGWLVATCFVSIWNTDRNGLLFRFAVWRTRGYWIWILHGHVVVLSSPSKHSGEIIFRKQTIYMDLGGWWWFDEYSLWVT